ncbi:hypothetical protein D3C78_1150330 [compost metagenome]
MVIASNLFNQEGNGQQNTTTNDKRQHMRYSVHQVLIYFAPYTNRLLSRLFITAASSITVDWSLSIHRFSDQLFRLADTIANRSDQHRLSFKTGHLHIFISCDNDTACTSDLINSQYVLSSLRAVRLHPNVDSHFQRLFLQRILCHKGMGDSSRAGSNSDYKGL